MLVVLNFEEKEHFRPVAPDQSVAKERRTTHFRNRVRAVVETLYKKLKDIVTFRMLA